MDLRSSFALDRIAACEARPDRLDPRSYAARDKARDGTFVHVRSFDPTGLDESVVGLVATVWVDGSERIVGRGSFVVEPWTEPRRAEVTFTVLEAWRGRGIGRVLLAHLARLARNWGAEVLLSGSARVS